MSNRGLLFEQAGTIKSNSCWSSTKPTSLSLNVTCSRHDIHAVEQIAHVALKTITHSPHTFVLLKKKLI